MSATAIVIGLIDALGLHLVQPKLANGRGCVQLRVTSIANYCGPGGPEINSQVKNGQAERSHSVKGGP